MLIILVYYVRIFKMALQPLVGQGILIFEASRLHTLRHTALSRTPLDGWSAQSRDKTQHSQETDILPPRQDSNPQASDLDRFFGTIPDTVGLSWLKIGKDGGLLWMR
jgi:hypothetical protein